MEKMMEEKMNTIKKLTPPKEGLDSLLHLTTTSFLFLIPKDCENLSKTSLHIIDVIIPPIKKLSNCKTSSKII